MRVDQGIHTRDGRGRSSGNRNRENAAVAGAARPAIRIDGRVDGHDDGQNRHDSSRRELSSEGFHRPHHSPHSARGSLLPSTLRLATRSVNENSRRQVSVTRAPKRLPRWPLRNAYNCGTALFGGLQLPNPVYHVRGVDRSARVLHPPHVRPAILVDQPNPDFAPHQPEVAPGNTALP